MLSPDLAEQIARQRLNARRAMAQGRRWYIRSGVLLVVAVFATRNGGQVNYVIAAAMVLLAALCLSLGRTTRASARSALDKIAVMEQDRTATSHQPPATSP